VRVTIVHVTTVSMTLPFLAGQVRFLRERGHDVHLVCCPDAFLEEVQASTGARCHGVAMTRHISPLSDCRALWRLFRLFRSIRPDVVHAHTPKGGMLGVIAARLARVPAVVYTIHGLPFATATGVRRALLKATELVSCRLADRVFCVSSSMRSLAIAGKVTDEQKLSVLAHGSVGGVDACRRFNPALRAAEGADWRAANNVPDDAVVATFIGRLTRDKGVLELEQAWQQVRTVDASVHLVIAGPLDSFESEIVQALERLEADPHVHLIGLNWDTPPILAASDLVVLPTYREGFPVTLLEAAAMALPVVATAVPGCTDAVIPGVTGTLVAPRNADALAQAIRSYLGDPALRTAHGAAARSRVVRDFRPEQISNETLAAYRTLCGSRDEGAKPVTAESRATAGIYRTVSKRCFDVLFASVGLVLLAPVLLTVALLVRVFMGSPIWFRQERPGRAGRPFTLIKFRTMRDGRPGEPDATRLTAFGQFLRSSSLDELPELWNVLKGEMSLVGPRPLLMQYLDRYTTEQARRHEIRPGITGLAQVNGRNAMSWDEKFTLDVRYVDNVSLSLDLKILALTVWNVVARHGISQPGQATAQEFMGSASR
jgi:lipopolysaccharide/colanic/teichoic acid biosynthesis glycosyltransferase/glycosyltransferase involved in cell wall biosynthesis